MPYKTGVKPHDDTVAAAEGVRQVAVAAAGSNMATARSAEITFYRSCYNSAVTNSISTSVFVQALFSLGVRS
jgi:hypothetical protein